MGDVEHCWYPGPRGRICKPLEGLTAAVYLTSDAVIAATKDTMEDTIQYIDEKYGGAASYLHEVATASLCA